jgi:quercetin dioxygenase-like cupin family protein
VAQTAAPSARVAPGRAPAPWVQIGPGISARLLVEGHGTAMMLYRLDPGSRFEQHHHDFPELGVVLSGEGTFRLADGARRVRAGDSYYFPANTEHGFVTAMTNEPVVMVDVSAELSAGAADRSADAIIEQARSAARRVRD